MSEEKIRNYKPGPQQGPASESIPSFLLKTYQILQNIKYSDIICWTKNGQGFVVKKVKEFAENILPIHFRHSNYTSFVRQVFKIDIMKLNMYDFHKTRQQNQENAFKNSMFKRGQKHLLKQIERKDYKKKKEKSDSYDKPSNVINQNQLGSGLKQDKKIQEAKQLHYKIVSSLKELISGFEDKQLQLSSICSLDQTGILEEVSAKNGQDLVCDIMDRLYQCNNFHNQARIKLDQLSKNWQSYLNIKQKALRNNQESNQQFNKKESHQDPTISTFKNIIDKGIKLE